MTSSTSPTQPTADARRAISSLKRLTAEQIGTLRALELRTAAHGQLNTRTLRVLEERGLVGFAIGRQHWFLKMAGRKMLSRIEK